MKKKFIIISSILWILILSIITSTIVINELDKYTEISISNVYETNELNLGKIKCNNLNMTFNHSQARFTTKDNSFIKKLKKSKYFKSATIIDNTCYNLLKKDDDYYVLEYNSNDNSYFIRTCLESITSSYDVLFPGIISNSTTIDFSKTYNIKNITELYNFYNDESPYYVKKDNKIYLNIYNRVSHKAIATHYVVINNDASITIEAR